MSDLILPGTMEACLCYAALKMQGFFLGRQWVSFGGGYSYQMSFADTLYALLKSSKHSHVH